MRKIHIIAILLVGMVMLVSMQGTAVGGEGKENGYEVHFKEAAVEYGVPEIILAAIAQVESDCHPYAVNVEGKRFYPKTKERALLIIGKAVKQGKSFDVGIMQINRQWFDKYKYSYQSGLNVQFNIRLGAFILAREFQRSGYTWESIGRYHSPSVNRGRKYAWRVYEACLDIGR